MLWKRVGSDEMKEDGGISGRSRESGRSSFTLSRVVLFNRQGPDGFYIFYLPIIPYEALRRVFISQNFNFGIFETFFLKQNYECLSCTFPLGKWYFTLSLVLCSWQIYFMLNENTVNIWTFISVCEPQNFWNFVLKIRMIMLTINLDFILDRICWTEVLISAMKTNLTN